ncbi:RibD C-terminal domain [Seminavis robusta]|uniref:RibD C-terminal domain n=1 Tax=Seminavis robusta TaxID=568900 RepID=A0A9N8HAH1_9STRA|nr:RibD C-terminal domain [Seminavis robusta]|eukprot:Sro241_g096500.1 RibD C-terminal domain (188) ;mRNA; f:82133-82696
MTKGSVYIATSLDGYIAKADGDIDWLNNIPPPAKEEGDMGFAAYLASVDCMVMGRNTFDKVLSFGKDVWPYGTLKVVVWSRTMKPDDIPDYRRDTVSCSALPPKELMQELQDNGHKKAYIDGGVTVQEFLKAGMVQEICLSLAPILLGSGIKLFPTDGPQFNLKLKESMSYSNGMVQSTYEVLPNEE